MASAADDVLTTKEVDPNAFTNLLVDRPELVAGSSVVCSLLWILLIPVFGAPALDTGGDAFRASTGVIPENDFTFKAGLRASVSTGFDPVCEDIDFSTFPGVGTAGVEVRSYFLVFVPTIREIRDFYREM
eukprot:SAG31_NODE_338_length_17490_cov_7.707032_14_plen_130_part_00